MSDEAPIAYLHTLDSTDGIEENEPSRRLTFSPENPFGKPGLNYSEEYPWTAEPLYRGDEITRLRVQLHGEIDSNQNLEKAYQAEIKGLKEDRESLRDALAAVTAERDRMMAAFEKAANDMRPMLRSMISRNEAEEIVRRAARTALEGVTKPAR